MLVDMMNLRVCGGDGIKIFCCFYKGKDEYNIWIWKLAEC